MAQPGRGRQPTVTGDPTGTATWGGPVSVDSTAWESTGATATIWRGDRPVYDRGETVCVIGAGLSGLAAIKNLREHGFAVDCFERETGVGGLWNWRHGRSPVYPS